jgi:hypothetical protein
VDWQWDLGYTITIVGKKNEPKRKFDRFGDWTMKTSELIAMLQKEDPNDECIVCVGVHPVRWVEKAPWYYDGRLEFIERDQNNGVIKAGFRAGGSKLKLHYDTLEDALMDNPDTELELSGITYNGKVDENYMRAIKSYQKDGQAYKKWQKDYEQAKKLGLPQPKMPPITIESEPETLQDRIELWLRKLGLLNSHIDDEN